MTSFMHKLAEGLRSREKYLEDHSAHPVFDTDSGKPFKEEYENLMTELKEFTTRVDELTASGKDYDEHFEKAINDEDQKLSIKIDSWVKNIKE